MIDLDKKQNRVVNQDQRENIGNKGAQALCPYSDLSALCSLGLHLEVDQERAEVSDQYRGGSVHSKSIRENIHSETYCKGYEQQIHPVNVRRHQQYARNIDKAEGVIEQDHIAHEEDLQE